MKKNELKGKLEVEGFNPYLYSLNDLKMGALCLKESYGTWLVKYYEPNGILTMEKLFSSEDEACDYFYETLKQDPTTRMKIKP